MGFFGRRSKKSDPAAKAERDGELPVSYSEGDSDSTGPGRRRVFLVHPVNGLSRTEGFMDGVFDDSFTGYTMNSDVRFAANDWYEVSASRGNCDAQFNLGFNLEHGIGTQRNVGRAVEWYSKAATGGNVRAQYCLGCIYASDREHADLEKAYDCLSRAATEGFPRASYLLYVMYMKGMGLDEPNPYMAVKFLKQAAEEKDPASLYAMGQLSLYGGEYVDRSGDRAWRYLEEAALRGCIPALTSVGVMLCFGLGGRNPNRDAAYSTLMAASNNGDVTASNALGLMHLYSMTQDCSPRKSEDLFRTSAAAGDGAAMNNLAVLQHFGMDGEGDPVETLRKAAESGSVHATENISAISSGRPMACELDCGCISLSLIMDDGHAGKIKNPQAAACSNRDL